MEQNAICIAAVADDGFAQHLGVTLCSLIQYHSQGLPLRIFILDGGIGKDNKSKLLSLSQSSRVEISFVDVPKDLYASFPVTQPQSLTTYYKLSIPDVLPIDVKKVIYLDSDLVLLDEIQKLWETAIGPPYVLAAVEEDNQARLKALGIPSTERYFNAGVFVMDVEIWRREKISSQIRDFIHENIQKIKWCEQDAMNAVLKGRWFLLDARWNRPSYKLIMKQGRPVSSPHWALEWDGVPAIIHFLSEHKPWQYANQDPMKGVYFQYLAQTPWRDFKFKDKTLFNIFIKGLFTYCPPLFLKNLQRIYRSNKAMWRECLWGFQGWGKKHWTKSISRSVISVCVVSFIASLCDMLLSLVLGRSLTESLFGRINFILGLIALGVLIFTFGQQMVLIRILSRPDGTEFNWHKFIRQIMAFSGAAGIVYVLSLNFIYGLWEDSAWIFMAMMLLILIEFLSAFLRAHHRFLKSIMILKMSSAFLLALGILCFTRGHDISISNFFLFYAVSLSVPVYIGIKALGEYSNGKKDIGLSWKDSGALIFLIGLTYTLTTSLDRFFIVKILGYGQFGSYAAVSTIIKVYDFITAVFCYVLIPIYSHGKRLDSLKKDFVRFLISAVFLSFLVFIAGHALINIMFHGRYDKTAYLLNYFIIVGILKVLFIIPASLINGYLPKEGLQQFFNLLLIGLISYFIFNYALITNFGLTGASIGLILIWAYLVVSGYWVSLKHIKAKFPGPTIND